MTDAIPVCPECGGPMHLTGSSYGRAWECDQRQDAGTGCQGRTVLMDDDTLTSIQIAEDMLWRKRGSAADDGVGQGEDRHLAAMLRDLIASPYLSRPEKCVLVEARAIVERLAEAAELARDGAKRQEQAQQADREARYRQALGLLGPSLAPDPSRLEASAIELLALDRYSDQDQFGSYDSIEAFEVAFRRRAGSEQDPLDLLFRDLTAGHQLMREAIARNWSGRTETIKALRTRLSNELPRLCETILASPPVFLQGVRRLLAESEPANVVRLPPRRSP